jgi:hypothetical protein
MPKKRVWKSKTDGVPILCQFKPENSSKTNRHGCCSGSLVLIMCVDKTRSVTRAFSDVMDELFAVVPSSRIKR